MSHSVSDDRRAILWKFPEAVANSKLTDITDVVRENSQSYLDLNRGWMGGTEEDDSNLAHLFLSQYAAREERLRARYQSDSSRLVDDTKIKITTREIMREVNNKNSVEHISRTSF